MQMFNAEQLQEKWAPPQEDLVREIYLNDNRVFIDDVMKDILKVD